MFQVRVWETIRESIGVYLIPNIAGPSPILLQIMKIDIFNIRLIHSSSQMTQFIYNRIKQPPHD